MPEKGITQCLVYNNCWIHIVYYTGYLLFPMPIPILPSARSIPSPLSIWCLLIPFPYPPFQLQLWVHAQGMSPGNLVKLQIIILLFLSEAQKSAYLIVSKGCFPWVTQAKFWVAFKTTRVFHFSTLHPTHHNDWLGNG